MQLKSLAKYTSIANKIKNYIPFTQSKSTNLIAQTYPIDSLEKIHNLLDRLKSNLITTRNFDQIRKPLKLYMEDIELFSRMLDFKKSGLTPLERAPHLKSYLDKTLSI